MVTKVVHSCVPGSPWDTRMLLSFREVRREDDERVGK